MRTEMLHALTCFAVVLSSGCPSQPEPHREAASPVQVVVSAAPATTTREHPGPEPSGSTGAGVHDASPEMAPAQSAAASAQPDAAAAPPPPDAITCKTVEDCWMERANERWRPIRRPAKMRGRKFAPCHDGEHGPGCRDGVCVVVGWKC